MEELGNPPHEAPRGMYSTEDLNLSEELILDADRLVSLQGCLFMFTNRLRMLLIQLFLKAGEYLEDLTFSGEPFLRLVDPHLERGSSGRLLFADVFDVNV